MQYTGVDIVEIARIEEAIGHWGDSFLERVYTASELKLFRRKTPSLAARFAAKEAVIKALNRYYPMPVASHGSTCMAGHSARQPNWDWTTWP